MKFLALAGVAYAARTRQTGRYDDFYDSEWDNTYYADADPYVTYHEPQHVHHHDHVVYADPAPTVVYDDHYGPTYEEHEEHGHHHYYVDDDYEHLSYHDEDYVYVEGNVPTGDFWHKVDDLNVWEEIWDQHSYEERVQSEAELMIALEATREALVDLDYDIDRLEDLIDENHRNIDRNHEDIRDNDDAIEDNDNEIDDQ